MLCNRNAKTPGGELAAGLFAIPCAPSEITSAAFACVQVSCIYGLGMPSKYLEASIRIVVGQEWTGGWRTFAQHLEQVPRHAGAFALHFPHACLLS